VGVTWIKSTRTFLRPLIRFAPEQDVISLLEAVHKNKRFEEYFSYGGRSSAIYGHFSWMRLLGSLVTYDYFCMLQTRNCFTMYTVFRIFCGFGVIWTNWPSDLRLTHWSWTLISVNRTLFWDFAILLGFTTCKKVIVLTQSVIWGSKWTANYFCWAKRIWQCLGLWRECHVSSGTLVKMFPIFITYYILSTT
jgi:hypothetical protein